jgi:hypothetical protein
MNRPIGPADAPLATKLASLRPELAALQTEVGTSLPAGPVAGIQQVKNDVRLPSHALLEAVLPAGAPAASPRADAPASLTTQWSAAARAIGAVLADLDAEPEPVRGAAPLWPSPKAPAGAVLAGALAQTVTGSGLFYESHLLEFANGLRTLAQLAQEPQVRLTQPATSANAGAVHPQPGQVSAGVPFAANPLFATSAAGQPIPAVGQAIAAASQPAGVAGRPASNAPAQGQPAIPAPSDAPAQVLATAYTNQGLPAASAAEAPALPGEPAMAPDEHAASRTAGESSTAASSARAAAPAATAAEVIHPQTVALVHQQLDLLATSVFRWSGEAWPNVPMEWAIHEEAEHSADTSGHESEEREEPARRWATTVSLSLPNLGAVNLRLSLTGESVQAHLAASETATLARLRSDGNELGPRLEAAGLRLQDLQITAMGKPVNGVQHAAGSKERAA